MRKIVFVILSLVICLSVFASDVIIDGTEEVNIKVKAFKAEGEKGDKGDPGEKGDKGDKGDPGPQGPPGDGSGFSDVINILDFGADRSGEKDSTDAIQAAVDSAIKGKTVYFPHGKFKVSKTILVSKGINLIGSGLFTQIFQTADDDLFHLYFNCRTNTGCAGSRIEDMSLTSAATSPKKALLFLDGAPYNVIRDIALAGGNLGIYIKGGLGNKFYNLYNTYYPNVPIRHPIPEWMVFAESGYGRAINHTVIRDTHFQQQMKGGIRIERVGGSPEGGIEIDGNLIEGLSGTAISFSGVGLPFSIHGVHFEANAQDIELSGCARGSIYNCMALSGSGVKIKRCRNVAVRDGYFNVSADESSSHLKFSNFGYYKTDIKSTFTTCVDLCNVSNSSLGACGQYTGETPKSEYDGSFGSWAGSAPEGYKALGTIRQEMGIVYVGTSAVRVKHSIVCGLRLDLPVNKIAGLPVTVSVWVYKPRGGFDPRICMIYNNWGANTLGPVERIPEEQWTRIKATFYVPPNITSCFALLGAYYSPPGPGDPSETIFDEANIAFVQY